MSDQICIICKTPTHSFRHPKSQVLFHECPNCEVIFKDEKHYPSREQERQTYDDHHNSIDDFKYVNYLNNFIDCAVLPFKQSGEVLDFGSGPVPVLATLIKQLGTFEVDIYDLHYADERVFEFKHYDIITTTEVIEHLQKPIDTILMLKNHLKPNGIMSIMTLFHPKNHDQFLDWFYIRDVTHLVFFTSHTMSVIAEILDLKLIDTNDYRYAVFQKQ